MGNEYQVHADIDTVKVVVKNVPDYAAGKEKNDLGFLTFDLQADLNPLFNWNVKQLFLYLTAEYETPNNKLNQDNVPRETQFLLPRHLHHQSCHVSSELQGVFW